VPIAFLRSLSELPSSLVFYTQHRDFDANAPSGIEHYNSEARDTTHILWISLPIIPSHLYNHWKSNSTYYHFGVGLANIRYIRCYPYISNSSLQPILHPIAPYLRSYSTTYHTFLTMRTSRERVNIRVQTTSQLFTNCVHTFLSVRLFLSASWRPTALAFNIEKRKRMKLSLLKHFSSKIYSKIVCNFFWLHWEIE